jgi:hypothetical protein
MRNVARAMTTQEIDEASAYCASQPPEIVKATEQSHCAMSLPKLMTRVDSLVGKQSH